MPDIKAQNETALASVKAIYDAADEANTLLDGMQTAATQAGTTLNGIYATAVQAEESASSAQASADSASEYASRALGNLASVQSVTETLNWITAHGTMTLTTDTALDPSHVYFVVDANGDYVVGGTHYSVVSEPVLADIGSYYELSINESLNNYVATHLVVDTEGLWIIPDAGGNKVLIATGSGSTYSTAGTYIVGSGGVVLASFTSNGAQIGQNVDGQSYTQLTSSGMKLYRTYGSTSFPIATFGYGAVANGSGNKVDGMYCSLGHRRSQTVLIYNYNSSSTYKAGDLCRYDGDIYVAKVDITTPEEWNANHWGLDIGESSMSEGGSNTASGYCSHAEGTVNSAIGDNSHAEGHQTKALDSYGHAEGYKTLSSGSASHAEGDQCKARADGAHAQNTGAVANSKSQTALGEYNVISTYDQMHRRDYAVIVGNGINDNNRSNALTVDWSGNVVASGDITDGNGNALSDKADATALADYVLKETPYFTLDTTATSGTDKEIYDALVSLGWDSDVIV